MKIKTTSLTAQRYLKASCCCKVNLSFSIIAVTLFCGFNIVLLQYHAHTLTALYDHSDDAIVIDTSNYGSIITYIEDQNKDNIPTVTSIGDDDDNIIYGNSSRDNLLAQEFKNNAKPIEQNDDDSNKTYNATEYKLKVQQSMDPSSSYSSNSFPSASTGAWIYGFWGGFCNQYFTFLGIVFLSNHLPSPNHGHDQQHIKQRGETHYANQIYVHSLHWKDLYGTDQRLRHEILFDVYHWNTYYPRIPKLSSEIGVKNSLQIVLSSRHKFVFCSFVCVC